MISVCEAKGLRLNHAVGGVRASLRVSRARVAYAKVASRRVLEKCGFRVIAGHRWRGNGVPALETLATRPS
jgi:hypothetical protein